MLPRRNVGLWAPGIVTILLGCSFVSPDGKDGGLLGTTDSRLDSNDTTSTEDSDGDDTISDVEDSDSVFSGTDTSSDSQVCDADDFAIESVPPNLLILLDRSGSMSENVGDTGLNRWEVCSEAIASLTDRFDTDIRFGIATFSSCLEGGCSAGSIHVPIAPSNAAAIHQFLERHIGVRSSDGETVDDQGYIHHLCDSKVPETSTGSSLGALLGESSLQDAGRENAVLLLTDGAESGECIENGVDGPEGAARLLAQSIPVKTYAVGFEGANMTELEEIAQAGATNQAYYADDPTNLNAALQAVAGSVVSCTYILPGLSPEADKDKVNFYFDGEVVGHDPGCAAGTGWTWTDATKTAVDFCEKACDAMKSGDVAKVTAKFGCKTIPVV